MKLKTILIISAITTPLSMLIMVLHGAPLKIAGVTPRGIIDLELAGTLARANEIYTAWHPAIATRAIKNTFIDFLFLISYGTFLFAACRSLSLRFNSPWRKTGHILSILMIVAACFDALENVLMISILSGHIKKELVASAFFFASIKFLLAALGVLYIIASLVAIIVFKKPVRSRLNANEF